MDVLEPGPGPCNPDGTCTCAKGFAGPTCGQIQCNPSAKSPCNDGNPCTIDVCSAAGTCDIKFSAEVCDDGAPCTYDTTCKLGTCIGPMTPLCDDLDPCTVDSCDGLGGCIYSPLPGCGG